VRPSVYWDCGFESRQRVWIFVFCTFMCCQLQASATGRSLVQGNPTECVYVCVWCVCVCECVCVGVCVCVCGGGVLCVCVWCVCVVCVCVCGVCVCV